MSITFITLTICQNSLIEQCSYYTKSTKIILYFPHISKKYAPHQYLLQVSTATATSYADLDAMDV